MQPSRLEEDLGETLRGVVAAPHPVVRPPGALADAPKCATCRPASFSSARPRSSKPLPRRSRASPDEIHTLFGRSALRPTTSSARPRAQAGDAEALPHPETGVGARQRKRRVSISPARSRSGAESHAAQHQRALASGSRSAICRTIGRSSSSTPQQRRYSLARPGVSVPKDSRPCIPPRPAPARARALA